MWKLIKITGLDQLFGEVIKKGVLTMIVAYSMKALDKKDYANIIKICGVGLIGQDVFEYANKVQGVLNKPYEVADNVNEHISDLPLKLINFAMKLLGDDSTGTTGGW